MYFRRHGEQMGLFDKLGKGLGVSKDMNVEEYMTSEEMENVDVLNEPADFYIKPVALKDESDIAVIEAELNKKNIILLNTSEMKNRENTTKKIIDSIKEFVTKMNGDIAAIDNNKLIITPAKVKIIKNRKRPDQAQS
jgi:Uncharacterized conserved protein, COG2450